MHSPRVACYADQQSRPIKMTRHKDGDRDNREKGCVICVFVSVCVYVLTFGDSYMSP